MKSLLPVFLLLSFVSCKLTEKNIDGLYKSHLDFENHTELKVNKDKTYSIKKQMGPVYFEGAGNWAIRSDTLILANRDQSLLDNNPIKKQMFLIKKHTLEEIGDLFPEKTAKKNYKRRKE